MTNFDSFCDKVVAVPYVEKVAMINAYSDELLPVFDAISEDGMSGTTILTHFLLCAIAADGKLAEEEFRLLKPLFDSAAGKDCTFEEAKAIFREAGLDNSENYKKVVDLMVDMFGLVSEDLKYAATTMCLLVCAIDGEVSPEEKDWIKQLVDDNFGLSVMEQIDAMLGEAGSFILATEDGDQPRMRVLGFRTLLDGKIYFAVGTYKDVYRQMQANPKCEILASLGMSFLRWDGKAVFVDDPRLPEIARAAMPQVTEMYEKLGLTLGFFCLEGGSAEVVGVDNSKKKLF